MLKKGMFMHTISDIKIHISYTQLHFVYSTTLQAEPVLGGKRLDLYKIYQSVVNAGGFEEVTKNRGWKQIGDIFKFPSTCTNSAYILKGVYIRNLLGWEEEKLWKRKWEPPKELLGPNAHKPSNLAGKAFRSAIKKTTPAITNNKPTASKSKTKAQKSLTNVSVAAAAATAALLNPLKSLQQTLDNPLLWNLTINDTITTDITSDTTTTLLPQQQQQPAQLTPLQIVEQQLNNLVPDKDRIVFTLQFGQKSDIDAALNQLVAMSFDSPEKLDLNVSPLLLQSLVSLAQPCLLNIAVTNALPTTARDTLNNMLLSDNMDVHLNSPVTAPSTDNNDILSSSATVPGILQSENLGSINMAIRILHILRNFSLVSSYALTLAQFKPAVELLVQALQTAMSTGQVELGRHSIDALENMAAYIEFSSPTDPCLQCVYTLIAAHDRYLVIGAIRTLTWFTMNKKNAAFLASNFSPVIARIEQMLLSNDEELVGTSLEYIYQYTKLSTHCRLQFLSTPYAAAYIGLFVSLLLTKSKYFNTRFIEENHPSSTTTIDTCVSVTHTAQQQQQQHKQTQQVAAFQIPDLTVYHNLDEPYRCLGWLKDKFEFGDKHSVLSLDDMYLLYEARFGLEKALKMRDFYTVMKIAFPKSSSAAAAVSPLLGPSRSSVPVVEGLNIYGLQIKTNILQDRPQVACKWAQCSLLFDDTFTLQRHVLHDHMVPIEIDIITNNNDNKDENNKSASTTKKNCYVCSWSHCHLTEQHIYYESKNDFISHLRTHFYNQVGESCCNSPIQSPVPSLASSPSSPTSNVSSSSSNTTPNVSESNSSIKSNSIEADYSEIQGIALAAAHLLQWLSEETQKSHYFIPFEKTLKDIAEQRPKLASRIQVICSNYKSTSSKPAATSTTSTIVDCNTSNFITEAPIHHINTPCNNNINSS
ncbi:hypothetical protein BDF20DRAFT_854728 [Mycotypha africana]|uniref:uncharacterized protein n=1 Tax=Mycotypha africana TaxID=64632 RepID=UPI0023010C61|nr:uncharacterized protein BDF20DRAFT_854728 [Mycotypha africana]KAI8988262.1 hypothetical protein BDF20DRAFT_854728 [Mycotypha africana]